MAWKGHETHADVWLPSAGAVAPGPCGEAPQSATPSAADPAAHRAECGTDAPGLTDGSGSDPSDNTFPDPPR